MPSMAPTLDSPLSWKTLAMMMMLPSQVTLTWSCFGNQASSQVEGYVYASALRCHQANCFIFTSTLLDLYSVLLQSSHSIMTLWPLHLCACSNVELGGSFKMLCRWQREEEGGRALVSHPLVAGGAGRIPGHQECGYSGGACSPLPPGAHLPYSPTACPSHPSPALFSYHLPTCLPLLASVCQGNCIYTSTAHRQLQTQELNFVTLSSVLRCYYHQLSCCGQQKCRRHR